MKKARFLFVTTSLLLAIFLFTQGRACVFNNANLSNESCDIDNGDKVSAVHKDAKIIKNEKSINLDVDTSGIDSSYLWDEIIRDEQEKQIEEQRKQRNKELAIFGIILGTGVLVFNIYKIVTNHEQKRKDKLRKKY